MRSKRASLRSPLVARHHPHVARNACSRAGDAPSEPDSLSAERLSRADSRYAKRRARAHDRGGRCDVARGRRRVRRRSAAGAARKNLPADVVWRDKPRFDIPGSLGSPIPVTGNSPPSCSIIFGGGSTKLWPGGARPLVFYCLKDCWMSWNAAKRALALGYSNVAWYPEGSDGWAAVGLPVENGPPEPDQRHKPQTRKKERECRSFRHCQRDRAVGPARGTELRVQPSGNSRCRDRCKPCCRRTEFAPDASKMSKRKSLLPSVIVGPLV